MTLGRLEVDQPRCSQLVLVLARAHEQSALKHHHECMLMHLMIIQPLALREGQQDHPVGVVVGTQHPWSVRLNLFGVQLPELHAAGII